MPWSGRAFRDLSGQQEGVFEMEGSLGDHMDYYVLNRERDDGSGTRIIRHRSQIEPTGSQAADTLAMFVSYHDAMDLMNRGISVVNAKDTDLYEPAFHTLLEASDVFHALDRKQEFSAAKSACADICDDLGRHDLALALREEALTSSVAINGPEGGRTLKRKYQLAATCQRMGRTQQASDDWKEIIDTSLRINTPSVIEAMMASSLGMAQLHLIRHDRDSALHQVRRARNFITQLIGEDNNHVRNIDMIRSQLGL